MNTCDYINLEPRFSVNFVPVWGRIASPIMHRFGRCLRHLLRDEMYFVTLLTVRRSVCRWRHKIRKIAVEILQRIGIQNWDSSCFLFGIVVNQITLSNCKVSITGMSFSMHSRNSAVIWLWATVQFVLHAFRCWKCSRPVTVYIRSKVAQIISQCNIDIWIRCWQIVGTQR